MSFPSMRMVGLVAMASFTFSACGGGGGSGSVAPRPVASATAAPGGGGSATAFSCPTSVAAFAVDRGGSSSSASNSRRMYRTAQPAATTASSLIGVTYRTSVVTNPASAIDARVASYGASKVGELAYAKLGYATRMLQATPATIASTEAMLRATPGVVAVDTSRRISALAVNGVDLTNNPFFDGASGAAAPLYETSAQNGGQGQWDMHIVQLEHAFAYSQTSAAINGSGVSNPNALGSTSVKLAIIDTGEDVTHPDLKNADIVRTRCFISNASGVQSTGTFVTDPDGHGTDVSGIAGSAVNDGFGFVGDAGNVALMLYRIFPTPDDNCANPNSTDAQCSATDVDIASAITDAVDNGANVINLSLGGDNCTTAGKDPDSIEGTAIENAIASDVIVVAASGNSGKPGVGAPACDAGVIAAGASAYADGQPNGSGNNDASGTEYVASYSQSGSVNQLNSTTSWGIVAPGGDATDSNDKDNLHWVENIWTSTPFDNNFAGTCLPDQFGEIGNCLTQIAGTSMSSPHIAGAAALILSVNAATYSTPAKMFALLCSTADNINDPHQGCGRLNVYRAMAKALNDPNPPT
jgi:subtilisin family serine protease